MIRDIRKFRFWCQKVIPLVYDNSLSYYEVLCKVVDYLNKVIEDVNEIPSYIDAKIVEALDDEHLKELIEEVIGNIESAISSNDEHDNTNSSADYNIGQMLWWKGELYKVIRQIDAGDTFIVDTNIELVNFEDLFDSFVDTIKHTICSTDDGASSTASATRNVGDLVWLNDVLYKVTQTITEGNAYVFSGENANVEEITIDEELKIGSAKIGNLDDLNTTDKNNLVSAINEIDTDLTNISDSLAQEIETRIENVRALNDRIDNINTGLYVSVKDYGAVGDGVTDDSDAIQDCIDNENYIYFPAGTYNCKLVNLKSHIKILGTRDSVVQLAPNLTESDVIGDVSTGLFTVDYACIFMGDNITDVDICGITLYGNPDNRSGEFISADLLWMYQCTDVNVHDLYAHHSLNSILHFYDCKRINIFNTYTSYSGLAVEMYPDETTRGGDNVLLHYNCSNCHLSNNLGDHAHNIVFEFEGRGLSAFDYASAIKICTVDGCIARDCRGHGFLMLNCQGVVITNCIAAGSTMYNGFEFLGGSRCTISNCVAVNNYRFNLDLCDESNEGAEGLNYPAPTFIRVDNFISYGGEGIQIRNASNISLSNITIESKSQTNYSNYGIWLYAISNCNFNNIKCAQNTNILYGIYSQGCTVCTFTDIIGLSNTYLIGIASCGRMVLNAITNRYGTSAIGISGNNNSIILNNVTEINTSSDITTLYGSDTAVTIQGAVVAA